MNACVTSVAGLAVRIAGSILLTSSISVIPRCVANDRALGYIDETGPTSSYTFAENRTACSFLNFASRPRRFAVIHLRLNGLVISEGAHESLMSSASTFIRACRFAYLLARG